MTDQNQQTVMLTDVHGNEYHSNMWSVTAILEHKYAGEVLLAFGISSAIKIPKSLNELIEKCNLNETAGFVTFTDPDNGDRILLNAHKKPIFVARKYDDRINIVYDNGIQIIVKEPANEVMQKLGMM
ncbi:hypothetical protein ACFGZ1_06090 [Pasteurella multocida]